MNLAICRIMRPCSSDSLYTVAVHETFHPPSTWFYLLQVGYRDVQEAQSLNGTHSDRCIQHCLCWAYQHKFLVQLWPLCLNFFYQVQMFHKLLCRGRLPAQLLFVVSNLGQQWQGCRRQGHNISTQGNPPKQCCGLADILPLVKPPAELEYRRGPTLAMNWLCAEAASTGSSRWRPARHRCGEGVSTDISRCSCTYSMPAGLHHHMTKSADS